MKRQLLLALYALLGVVTLCGQQRMVLIKDGIKDTFEIWRVDTIAIIADTVATVPVPDVETSAVDLGLKVRWANMNLGATKATEVGRLSGWGDVTLTNYSDKKQYFPVPAVPETIYGTNYDVASAKWGKEWHTPNAEEMQELIDNCSWTWKEQGDSVGYVVTSKVEGYESQSIFLPATGYRTPFRYSETKKLDTLDIRKGYYWTGNIGVSSSDKARFLSFAESNETDYKPALDDCMRYLGLAVRPVTGPVVVPLQILSAKTTSVGAQNAKIEVVLSGNKEEGELVCVSYSTVQSNLSFSASKDNSHEVSSIADTIAIELNGLTQKSTYYVRVYVKRAEGEHLVKDVSFTTTELDLFPVAQAVDLGLSVKWASWNMGSSSPLDIPSSDYARYGWGDPTGMVHSMTYTDYAASQWPDVMNNQKKVSIANTAYDIATVQWGQGWRLPTKEDFEELKRCTWTWVEKGTEADINRKTYGAWKIVGPNGNYIYLPAAGIRNTSGEIRMAGTTSFYWTATNESYMSALMLRLLAGGTIVEEDKSFICQAAIRPVYDDGSTSGSGSGTGTGGGTQDDDQQTDPIVEPEPEKPTAGNYVDLGVSVLWADRNVGSTSSTAYGSYFTWGDSISREPFNVEGYIHNVNTTYTVEGLQPLPAAFDAANHQWGGTWRTPTLEEWQELMTKCDWEWENSGFRVTNKSDATKSIFLPAAGYKMTENSKTNHYFTDQCLYWSSSIDPRNAKLAYKFGGKSSINECSMYQYPRDNALPIRPVMSK